MESYNEYLNIYKTISHTEYSKKKNRRFKITESCLELMFNNRNQIRQLSSSISVKAYKQTFLNRHGWSLRNGIRFGKNGSKIQGKHSKGLDAVWSFPVREWTLGQSRRTRLITDRAPTTRVMWDPLSYLDERYVVHKEFIKFLLVKQ